MRDSMIIYRSFFEAIKELKKEQQAEVWNAIFELGLNKQTIELKGISKTIFTLIVPQIEANLKRFDNGNKPKLNRSKTEANNKQNESEIEANNNNNKNVNNNNNKNNNIIFPTLQEVFIFFNQFDYTKEAAQKFYDYYSKLNWNDSKGNIVNNWQEKAKLYWFTQENKKTKPEFVR